MSLDDVTDILLEGTKEQISSLSSVSYEISTDKRGMLIACENEIARMYGDYSDAHCIALFGLAHTFPAKSRKAA